MTGNLNPLLLISIMSFQVRDLLFNTRIQSMYSTCIYLLVHNIRFYTCTCTYVHLYIMHVCTCMMSFQFLSLTCSCRSVRNWVSILCSSWPATALLHSHAPPPRLLPLDHAQPHPPRSQQGTPPGQGVAVTPLNTAVFPRTREH